MPFDGTQLNETAAHLLRAKRYLEEHGICFDKHREPKSEAVCVIVAMAETAPVLGIGVPFRTIDCFFGGLDDEHPWGQSISGWLSRPGRTVEEVYAAFDRAIVLAMESGDA